MTDGWLQIRSAAAPVLCQDSGRTGWAALGVPVSGAFDQAGAALAQRLVGNPSDETALEATMGQVTIRTDRTVTAAVTGADVAIDVAGRPRAVNEVFGWPAGTDLTLGTPTSGARNYLAVRGGLLVDRVLGSASHDVLSGLGPAPLVAGDRVALAHRPAAQPQVSHAPAAPVQQTLRVLPGPRSDWFTREAIATLLSREFSASAASNRIGVRLSGPRLQRARSGELPSEPLQRGAIQVPPNGQPIIMGPDHPTTGGYPVIATVLAADWSACGQLRPGDPVRFLPVPH